MSSHFGKWGLRTTRVSGIKNVLFLILLVYELLTKNPIVAEIFCSLRNRAQILLDFTAVLRNESLHLANLSDLKILPVELNKHHDIFNVMMLVCETGKTIKKDGKVQYGRVTRHKDVFLCSICVMGLYLMNRFYTNAEFYYDEVRNTSQFFINEEWIDRKLLVGLQTRDSFKSLSPKNFETSMKSVLRELGFRDLISPILGV